MNQFFSASRLCLLYGFLASCAWDGNLGGRQDGIIQNTTGTSLVSENIADFSRGVIYDPGFKELESRARVSPDKGSILGMWGRKVQIHDHEGSDSRECLLFAEDGSLYNSYTTYEKQEVASSADVRFFGRWMYAGEGLWLAECSGRNGKFPVQFRVSDGKLMQSFSAQFEGKRVKCHRVFERIN